MDQYFIDKLCCPQTRQPLHVSANSLVAADGHISYPITETGIPLFAQSFCSVDAEKQKEHYDKVANAYITNLGYPHTQEYMAYLDRVFLERVVGADMKDVAEICCGQGEAFALLSDRIECGIGVDISPAMLEVARSRFSKSKNIAFVQGDATTLPLADQQFSSVFMLGGIHHVSNRQALFREVFRILRPRGKFYWREPVSDFFLWKWLRSIIYKLSPMLDAETERPLLWHETVPPLKQSGFCLTEWHTYGFLGFCIFMNSDVLIFNRAFRFIPGIRFITRAATRFDEWMLRIPGLTRAGLQVVGVAEKPGLASK